MLHHLKKGLQMYILHIFRQQLSFSTCISITSSIYMEECSFTCISKLYDIYKENYYRQGQGEWVGKIFIFFFVLLQSSRTTGQDGECEFADSPAPLQRHQGAAPLCPRAVRLLPPVCCRGDGPRKPDSHTSAIHQVGVRDGRSFH